ncbi:MAG: phage integrase family protein, partial [Planctomycetes bacterium]|nr:phage integrase family protein [Planctomycetota bacterium]
LVDACEKIPGKLRCGVKTGAFLQAWVRVGYDTGLRPVDLRLLRWNDVDFNRGMLSIVQHKTKRAHTARLSPTACELLAAIERPPREKVFPLSKSGIRRIELILFATAQKLGFRRMRGQALGTLRKSHATQVYEAEGEFAAAESLGHVGGVRTVRRSYIDSRSIKAGRLPPDLSA